MATGDQNDVLKRLVSNIPASWFSDAVTTRNGIFSGAAYVGSFIYSLISYSKLQTRIKTATDGFLDMISFDFFGTNLQRRTGQTDTSFRGRIITNLFRERGTRNSITKVLTDLTGRAPVIFEPRDPLDTGGLGVSIYLGSAGRLGSFLMPYEALVDAYRPATSGIPNIPGLGVPQMGLGISQGGAILVSLSDVLDQITDADIYDAINSVRLAATTVWVRINS